MRSHTRSKLPPEQQAELERLEKEVKRFDDKGLHDTVHHEMLKRLRAELGLIPARKIEEQKDGLSNGKQDL